MKLVRFGEAGIEAPGVLIDDKTILDISGFEFDINPDFFDEGWQDSLQRWIDTEGKNAPTVELAETRLGPPVNRPGKILCVGQNYKEHVKETGAKIPKEPVLFSKSPTALNAPNGEIEIPRTSEQTDWEVELAFVIGKRTKYVSEAEALSCIAGYTIMNDVSERSFQKERSGQWVKGKSHDTFAPLGPWLVTPDEIADPQNLELTLERNGKRMQTGNTSDMIFTLPFLISYISQFMTLAPGDVVSTGTPPGVGLGMNPPQFMQPGDVIELRIEGLGTQRQTVVAAK